MTISVIISTCNRVSELKECILCLIAQNKKPSEILVVDNSCKKKADKVFNLVENFKKFTKIPLLYLHKKKIGVSHCRNEGIKKSNGKILAFLDDDTTPDKNWCRTIEKSVQKNPHSIIVGNYFSESVNDIFSYVQYLRRKRIFMDTLFKKNNTIYCRFLDTKNFAVPKNILIKNNLFFDTTSGFCRYSSCEDLDFSNKAWRKGITLLYNSSLRTIHKNRKSMVKMLLREFKKGQAFYYFNIKWSNYRLNKTRFESFREIFLDRKFQKKVLYHRISIIILFLLSSLVHKLGIFFEKVRNIYINKEIRSFNQLLK